MYIVYEYIVYEYIVYEYIVYEYFPSFGEDQGSSLALLGRIGGLSPSFGEDQMSEWCNVLQCVAVCCSVLQCVAVCCSVLQCLSGRIKGLPLALRGVLHLATCPPLFFGGFGVFFREDEGSVAPLPERIKGVPLARLRLHALGYLLPPFLWRIL